MNRTEAARLWSHVQTLLRQPSPPDDVELRRAARMLAASRSDAVELMLARWLADTRVAEAGEVAPAAVAAPVAAVPRRAGLGVRDVALIGAGVAGGALLAGALGADDAADASEGFGLFDAGLG